MRTAETIIKEYLELGYSPESLRVLAESRSEPLCTEMLGILAHIEELDAPEVACETACETVEDVFFVAADDESVSGEEAIDFDIMAGTASVDVESAEVRAGDEGSVAEILVEESEGTEMISAESAERAESKTPDDMDDANVWSRRWSTTAVGEVVPEVVEETCDLAEIEPVESATAEPVESAEVTEEREVVCQDETPAMTDAIGNPEAEADTMMDEQPAEDIATPEAEVIADNGPVADAEGSESAGADMKVVNELAKYFAAHAAIADIGSADAALVDGPAPGERTQTADEKLTRKERRRRERVAKKKAKGKKQAGAELPEIVLTRSEGTETLTPEEEKAFAVQTAQAMLPEAPATVAEAAEIADEQAVLNAPAESEELPQEENAVTEDAGEADAGTPEAEVAALALPAPVESGGIAGILEETPSGVNGEGEAVAAESTEPTADAAVLAESGSEEEMVASFNEPGAGDHLMIIASGGLDLRTDAYKLLSDELAGCLADYEPEGGEVGQGNVILFHAPYADDFVDDFADEEEEEVAQGPVLRMLPPVVDEAVEEDMVEESAELPHAIALFQRHREQEVVEEKTLVAEIAAPAQAALETHAAEDNADAGVCLTDAERLGLLKALRGRPEVFSSDWEVSPAEDDAHTIVAVAPEPETAAEREEAARAELEKEYQERLDEFAKRLLEGQMVTARTEAQAREKAAELAAKELEVSELRRQLSAEGEKLARFAAELNDSKNDNASKQKELAKFQDLRAEHEKLYGEFEDLRTAYNEVVTEVLPDLQGERDELVLTVERQCSEGRRLRGSLGSVRRRLAVGYSLGAAACLMLVALPVFNWMRSDEGARDIAFGHQQAGELRDRLEKAEQRNVASEKTIFELEQDAKLARMELASLEEKHQELIRVANQQNRELTAVRSGGAPRSSGTPTRTSTMALSGVPLENNRLHVNEVRDPAGSIEQTLAVNRAQRDRGNTRNDALASGRSGSRIPVSSVSAVRPPSGNTRTQVASRPTAAATAPQRRNDKVARVKAGEGVAQVVYRVLGTRDPEVIDWVIRENNIKKDRRGNPRIYPEQELRLPQGGRLSQTASAAGR